MIHSYIMSIYIYNYMHFNMDIYSPRKLLATIDGASLMHGSLSIYVCMDPFLGSILQVGTSSCSKQDLQKVFRGSMDPADALLNLDAFCRKYESFLCDLLRVTDRPTSKMLREASAKVWPGPSPLEHKNFNNHVNEVVKVLFGKARSMMKISEGLQQPWLELKVVGTPVLALPRASWINSELSIACPSWGVRMFPAVAMCRRSCKIFAMLAIRGMELKL